jgi:Histidine kinase-, DNA gyrase B-, and HSP90-like ATPase
MSTFGSVPPHPSALAESLGALGYSLEAAVADLIDNSIAAGASQVDASFEWNDGKPFARILDDGLGMGAAELVEAMRFGGTGPLAARRSDDLGRYGLGLKTASFSQCRRLTVGSRRDGIVSIARWDCDFLAAGGSWDLLRGAAPGSEDRVGGIESIEGSGTLVLWEVLRTGAESSLPRFTEALERVERHLAMVFHRYIDGDQRRVAIRLNGHVVKGWDPFVVAHPATMPQRPARLRDASGDVDVRGYVLPHRDRFRNADEHEAAGGPDGWVAQQGFYVYRAGRLILAGGWLGLGGSREWLRDEASQLARIRVDILNTADRAWRIDVRKATARPPAALRDALIRIAVDVRRAAREVYAHRGVRAPSSGGGLVGGLWRSTASRRYPFAIKRDHPAVQAVLDAATDPSMVEAMLLAIERSAPLPSAALGSRAQPEETDEIVLAANVLLRNLLALGLDRSTAIERVAGSEPFNQVAGIAERLRRENQHDISEEGK